MNAPVVLWETWHEQVKQVLEGIHGHQKKGLALLVLGIILSESVVLQRIAESVQQAGSSEAKMPSIERRLARFVANERIEVSKIWKQLVAQFLPYFGKQRLWFVLDCTPIDDRACIVYLGLLVHSRVLPVAWRVMPNQESWDEGQWELVGAMLDEIMVHLAGADCTLIADRGLTGMPLVKLCSDRHWHYLLRIAKEHTFRRQLPRISKGKNKGKKGQWSQWKACGKLIFQEGHRWFGPVQDGPRRVLGNVLECRLGARSSGTMVPDLRSVGWTQAGVTVCLAHACGIDLSRHQKSWVGPRGHADCGSRSLGSVVARAVCGDVVGGAFGGGLYS